MRGMSRPHSRRPPGRSPRSHSRCAPSSFTRSRSKVPSGIRPAFRAASSARQSEKLAAGLLRYCCRVAATTPNAMRMRGARASGRPRVGSIHGLDSASRSGPHANDRRQVCARRCCYSDDQFCVRSRNCSTFAHVPRHLRGVTPHSHDRIVQWPRYKIRMAFQNSPNVARASPAASLDVHSSAAIACCTAPVRSGSGRRDRSLSAS